MIIDTQTGERIEANAKDIFEVMADHFGKRVGGALPDDTSVTDAAAVGVRVGFSFVVSLMEGALRAGEPALMMGLMDRLIAQRDAWNLKDMTRVEFVDMTTRRDETAH